jgi:hypothetical protein
MKLIDVDSKATLEDFLTLKKDWTFYGNVMKKSVVTRMSLRSDRCRDVSFKKPVRWQWKNELL